MGPVGSESTRESRRQGSNLLPHQHLFFICEGRILVPKAQVLVEDGEVIRISSHALGRLHRLAMELSSLRGGKTHKRASLLAEVASLAVVTVAGIVHTLEKWRRGAFRVEFETSSL